MSSGRKWFAVFTALGVVTLVFGIGQGLADDDSTSEPDPVVLNSAVQDSALDPEVAEISAVVQSIDYSGDSEGNPTDLLATPGQQNPVEEMIVPEDQQEALVTYFKRYPGTAFQPRDSDTGYDYFGSGCISSKGADYFVVDLQLPTGAEIDFVRLYYYDTSTADSRMYLTWYDAMGGYSDVTYVDSSGSAGYGSIGGSTSYIVDPVNQGVALVWRPNTTGSTMALCGARIRYQVPFGVSFLPNITNNNSGG